jgi:hypothetical protein
MVFAPQAIATDATPEQMFSFNADALPNRQVGDTITQGDDFTG